MKRFGSKPIWAGLLVFCAVQTGSRSETNDLPHFQEVFRLLRANLEGVTEEDLNRAAVQGLLDQFSPRVMLVSKETSGDADAATGRITKSAVYDKGYGYVRVERVGKGLADEIAAAHEKLSGTNKLKGLILDLRFAGGQDYEAAAGAADRFLTKERPLLNWEEGSAKSKAKEDAITIPLAALVNRQTRGAAEALAAVLRDTASALLIGASTAGEAHVFREFTLSTGQQLRIATGSVVVGDGQELSTNGVAPDIEVSVGGDDEKSYFVDASKTLASTSAASRGTKLLAQAGSTNGPPRRRINEAELVRRQREGQDFNDLAGPTNRVDEERAGPLVLDPALARALDLLKGIVIVEQSRRH